MSENKVQQQHNKASDSAGLGVDKSGGPVIDPTKNVLDLVEAAVKRLDDMTELRAQLADEKIHRLEREQSLIVSMADLRAQHQKDIDTLESKRLDAMRQVDQLAVKTEADRASSAITALATQAATTAETLRSAVNTSATNLATQLDRTVTAITERIAALEKSSYTGAGKQAVIDPQLSELIAEMRAVSSQNAQRRGRDAGPSSEVAALKQQIDFNSASIMKGIGKTEGVGMTTSAIVTIISVIATLIGIAGVGVTLVIFLNRAPASTTTAPPTPQIIYTPSPPGTMLPTTPPAAPPR